MLIMLGDIIVDMEANKKLSPVVTELFIRGRHFDISLLFRSQILFQSVYTLGLNATHHFFHENTKRK